MKETEGERTKVENIDWEYQKDVDLMVGSLEHSLCSFGGFCCGRSDLVELQVFFI